MKGLSWKIASITGLAVLAAKLLSTLVVYHFLDFDVYLVIVAVAFLLAGMLLMPRLQKQAEAVEAATGPAIDTPTAVVAPATLLTNRELAIFEMLGRGITNKQIAEELCIEVSTVKSHINTLYPKIACKNRIEAREKWKALAEG